MYVRKMVKKKALFICLGNYYPIDSNQGKNYLYLMNRETKFNKIIIWKFFRKYLSVTDCRGSVHRRGKKGRTRSRLGN